MKKQIQKDNEIIIEANGILEKSTVNFFPKSGRWRSHCFNRPTDLSISNLPCNLRDDLWLARMLKKDRKLFYMSTNRILKFVKNSPFFQEKRHEYELEIVRWQIDWMRSDGENWIVDEEYGSDLVFLTPVCDLGFRKGIVDTLSKIGMNMDVIEEGIEKYADMWRDSFMKSAFRNKYEPVFADFSLYVDEDDKSKHEMLEPADSEHQTNWLKMRKYEYYQRHKKSVDMYGVVEAGMIMSDEEVAELKVYLDQKHVERMAYIEQYEQERYGVTGKTRILKK